MTTGAASISSTDLIVLYPQRIPNLKNPFAAGQGGRNNRSAGNYHFHRGPLDGRAYDSKGEGLWRSWRICPGWPMKRPLKSIDRPMARCSTWAPYRPYQPSAS